MATPEKDILNGLRQVTFTNLKTKVINLEEIGKYIFQTKYSNQFPGSLSKRIFQPGIACYILSLGLLCVVTCCYALLPVVTSLEGKKSAKLVSRLHFYISFQQPNTLLHMFRGLVTCWYLLLHL